MAVAASMLVVWLGGGCCGGRLVSVQVYESAPPQAPSPCLTAGTVGVPGIFGLHHGARLAGGDAGFRGPALVPPHPRFHPVPTQPVFEPRLEPIPLQVLEGQPTLPGALSPSLEPTPAKPSPADAPAA